MGAIRKQAGISLVTSLIMLTVLTVIVVSAIRSSNIGLRIAKNTQLQQEVTAAVRQAIESFISSDFTASLPTAATPVSINVTGGSTADYTASVAVPTCLRSVPLTNANLNPAIATDAACMGSDSAQNTGLMVSGRTVSTTNAWCYSQTWDVAATVTEGGGATVRSHQGIAERVIAGTACP